MKDGNFSVGVDGNDDLFIFYTNPDGTLYYIKYDHVGDSWGSETLYVSKGYRPSVEKHVIGSSNKMQVVYFGV